MKDRPRVTWALYRCGTCGRKRDLGLPFDPPHSMPCELPQQDGSRCMGTTYKVETETAP